MEKKIKNIHLIINPAAGKDEAILPIINTSMKEAGNLLSQGKLKKKPLDVGQFDKRYFIVGISLGYGADIVKGAARETKNKYGIFAYFLSAAAALKKKNRLPSDDRWQTARS